MFDRECVLPHRHRECKRFMFGHECAVTLAPSNGYRSRNFGVVNRVQKKYLFVVSRHNSSHDEKVSLTKHLQVPYIKGETNLEIIPAG